MLILRTIHAATASIVLAVLIFLALGEKVLSVRPYSAFDDGAGFAAKEDLSTTQLPANQDSTESESEQSTNDDPRNGKSGNKVTEVEATLKDPTDGQMAGGHVTEVTVEEKFWAGDPPGVKLAYHRGFGSRIIEWSPNGSWSKTRSLLDKRPGEVFVKAIGGTNVQDVDPQVVTELWAARVNGTSSYTVSFTSEPPKVTPALYVILCTLPWCLATCIACCTLPCAIQQIYTGSALAEVGTVVEESAQEPVPRLSVTWMSHLVEHDVTRWSLLGFGVGSVLLSMRTYACVLVMAPTTSAIIVASEVQLGALTFFVAAGVRATKANPLLASGSMCPQGLTKRLSKQLKYVLLSLSPMLTFVYLALMAWPALVCYIIIYGLSSLEALAEYYDILFIGPYLLIFVALPHFLINSHILAKVVEAHVRAATQKVEDILHLESQNKGDGMKQLKPKLKEIHEACIGLRVKVLPNLECIVVPTLGFAACSWGLVLMNIIEFLSGHLEDFGHGTIGIGVLVAQFLLVFLIFLPLGVNCLLPPASVSDAFDHLLEALNALRTLDGMEDDAQVRLTATRSVSALGLRALENF